MQLFLSKRQGDFYFTANYTLSKSEDHGSGNGDNQVEDWRDLEYYLGPSDFDRRHIVVGTWTYRLPFFRNSQSVAASILGGWEVSGVWRYQSGAPFTRQRELDRRRPVASISPASIRTPRTRATCYPTTASPG